MSVYKNFGLSAILVATALLVSGCASEKPAASNEGGGATSTSIAPAGDHSGWWCVEHAIPEAECSMCSAAYAKQCKEKGDWCEEHNRAESQCFICDPSRAEKFAKLYEAKFGKKPPVATE
jgi:hypothetical protein